jgi:hypothetical protein
MVILFGMAMGLKKPLAKSWEGEFREGGSESQKT